MEKFFKRPWLIVGAIGLITLFFALQLPRARLDNNNFRFVPEKDPERMKSARIDETFGSQTMILIGLERDFGTVLEGDFLTRLRNLDEALREIDIVDSVASIAATDYIDAQGDSIRASPLLPDDFSGSAEETALLKEKLLDWDIYRRALVSEDFSSTQIVVSLGVGSDEAGTPPVLESYRTILRLTEEAGFPATTIYAAGLPVVSAEVNKATAKDLIFLVPLVVIVLLVVFFLSFKRASSVLMPLLTVAVSATWAIGAMPLFGISLSILSTVLPVILLAVGSAYGIHVVSHYYEEAAERKSLDEEEHRLLVFAVLRRIGWPVFLAALTTFVGFASFCFTSVVPILEFGIFSSFGVLAAFGVSLTLLPALFIIRGPDKARPKAWGRHYERVGEDPMSAVIADALGTVARKRRTTLALAAAVVIVSIWGLSRMVIDNVLVEYFKPDTQVARSDRFIREKFGGTKAVSLVLKGDKPGEVLRPDVLAAVDGLASYLKAKVPEVGKITGFTDMIKRVNQVMNADADPAGLPKRAAPSQAREGPGAAGGEEPAFGFGFGAAEPVVAAVSSPAAAPTPAGAHTPEASDPGPLPIMDEASVPAPALDGRAAAALLGKALDSAGTGAEAEDLVLELKKAVNYRGAAYYEIPADPARYGLESPEELKGLISNYLVFLSGSLSSFADDPFEPESIRMSIQMRTLGQKDTARALAAMRSYVDANFPKDIEVEIGGTALVEASLNDLVVQSQIVSVLVSLLLVCLILSVYYRSIVAGLIGLAPLSVSILINFAIMGFTGIKLNIGTAMVASIAVGTGIDYTIHYMAAYHHEYLLTGGMGDFLRRTFLGSGKVILLNALSVGLGFLVLALSQFNILADLGKLIFIAMATSSLVSLTLLPVLLEVVRPAFIRKPLPSDKNQEPTEVLE